MTVKMDRYEIIENSRYISSKTSVGIKDNKKFEVIASFETPNKEVNIKFAKIILDELNTGKYEDLKSE